MSPPSTRPVLAWVVVAHTLAAAVIGALEASRLGPSAGRAIVPVFAVTGLAIGCVTALAERIAPRTPGWKTASVIALPSVVIAVPASLAVSGAVSWLAPVAVWLVTAAGIALGRLLAGDRMTRAIAILAVAGAIGGIVWFERDVVGARLPGVHLTATLAILALAGAGLRCAYAGALSSRLAAVIAAIALGTSGAAMIYGLRSPDALRRLWTFGDQSRDLVWMWRHVLDLDRDGSSTVLGRDLDPR